MTNPSVEQFVEAAPGSGGSSLVRPASSTDGRERGKGPRGEGPEEMRDGSDLFEDRSYAMVVSQNVEPFVFLASRKRSLSSPTAGDKDKRHKEEAWPDVNMEQEEISRLCKSTHHLKDQGLAISVSFNYKELCERVTSLKKTRMLLYFMGRVLSETQLHAWARAVGGINSFTHFIFLGKGLYLGICQDSRLFFELISLGGAWGNGLFALAMPWDPTFDPLQEFLHFCPVWVTLHNVLVFFLPYVDQLASGLGRVLFVPKLKAFVPSRNIRVCILWNLEQPIPAMLEIPLGEKNKYYLQVSFSSFPHACYKCRKIGHFAKSCPESAQVLQNSNKDKDNPSVNSSVQTASGLTSSKSVNCASGCKVSTVNEMALQNPFNALTTESSTEQDDMVAENGMTVTPIVENLSGNLSNIGSVLGNSVCTGNVDNKDGKNSNQSEHNPSVSATGPKVSSENGQRVELTESRCLVVDLPIAKNSSPCKQKVGSPQFEAQPLSDKTNGDRNAVNVSDQLENVQIGVNGKKNVNKTFGSEDLSRRGSVVGEACVSVPRLTFNDLQAYLKESFGGEENLEEDWINAPPPLPPSFGYYDRKTDTFKIKGRLVDSSYGKKIYFQNKKIRSLKSVLQEFRLDPGKLVFLDDN